MTDTGVNAMNDMSIEDRYVEAYLEKVREHPHTAAVLTQALEAEIRRFFSGVCKAYDFRLEERHVAKIPTTKFVAKYKSGVKQHQARLNYSPFVWVFGEDAARWPSDWWFRFGQEKWEDSTWRLLPALPASMLAAMGYPLVTSCRYMGDLPDEQKVELFELLADHDSRGWSRDADVARTKELLALTSYGMELPIIDVDTVKPPKDTPPERMAEARERIGIAATEIAKKMTAAWKEIFGVGVHWTVTNDRGGLHGRSLPLPPDLRHPDLLMMLTTELIEQCKKRGVPYKLVGGRGEWKNEDLAVVDLCTFQKSGEGRGGMWRSPGSKKDAHMGPGSLPQDPVTTLLDKMPWLSAITPEALGGDWAPIGEETKARILKLCVEHRAKKDAKEIRAGRAVVDENGKVRRLRSKPVEPDTELGTTEFGEVAATIRELMPKGEHEGMKRHDVRLALAGWFYQKKLTEEAASATLAASGGNIDDSRKVVRTTYARGHSGVGVAGMKRLVELLGKDAEKLANAFSVDYASRVDRPSPDDGPGDDSDDDPDDWPGGGGGDDPDGEPRTVSATTRNVSEAEPSHAKPSHAEPSHAEPSHAEPSHATHSHTEQPVAHGPVREIPVDENGVPIIKRVNIFPKEVFHFSVRESRDGTEYKGRKDKNGRLIDPNCAMPKTRAQLAKIRKGLDTSGKFWFVQKSVADTLALSGIGLDIVTRTALREVTGLDGLRSAFMDARNGIRKWKEGETLPKLSSITAARSVIGHWNYINLTDAMVSDLRDLGAPFDVMHRASLDQPWSGEERNDMKWLLDKATDGRAEGIKGPLKFIELARRCCWLLNKRLCNEHKDVSKIPVVCEREVSCKFCRSRLYAMIAEWIVQYWPHDRYVTFEVPATTEKVIKERRVKREVDANGKFVDKSEPSTPEDEAATNMLLPRAYPGEKRFRLRSDPEKKFFKAEAVLIRRRNRQQIVGRDEVTNLLDRIKIGFTKSHDFKEFKKIFQKTLGVRAWPTPTGIRVVMPSTFMYGEGESATEESTLHHLKILNLWQDRGPTEVSKEQVTSLILDARRRVGEGFDKLVYDLHKEEPDRTTPDLVEAEKELLNYAFLRNNAMRPVKNKAAERDLPWFTKEQMRKFMRMLARERKGLKEEDEVAPHECPVMVPDGKGGQRPCRKVLTVELENRFGVLTRNSQGKFYSRDEANEIADGMGMTFTSADRPMIGQFAPLSERMAS